MKFRQLPIASPDTYLERFDTRSVHYIILNIPAGAVRTAKFVELNTTLNPNTVHNSISNTQEAQMKQEEKSAVVLWWF